MRAEKFFVGLARGGHEISGKGYRRQPLILIYRDASDDFANEVAVAFDAAVTNYGFIDGLALANTPDGPVVAVSPLLLPINIATGQAFVSEPGFIVMSTKSLTAIRNIALIALT
jgi:hypothetical protein